MSINSSLQFGEKICYLLGLISFTVGLATANAAAPTHKPLNPDELQQLCSVGLDANSGLRYVDDLVSLLYEQQGDEFTLNTFSPFGTEFANTVGHNIYAGAYLKVAKEPTKNALERTGAATGLSGQEVQAILNGAVDVARTRKKNLTYEEAIVEAENIKNLYSEQINRTKLETEIRGLTTPMEIFTDGDLVNSGGFDLLADLDRIDYLLFFNQAEVSKGADLDFLSSPTPLPSSTPQISPPVSSTSTPAPVGGVNSGGVPAGGGGGGAAASSGPPAYVPKPEDNPLQCLGDTTLNSQVEASLKKPLIETEEAKNRREYEDNLAQNVQGSLATGENIKYPSGPELYPQNTDVEENKLDKKIKDALCNDWVCFEVIANVKQQSLFTDSANCVACHVEKARESLDKTVSKNLVPNKLTGNLMEAAKCKNATSSVGFPINVITVFNPIKTPPNTNQVGTEFLVSFDKILQASLGGDYFDPATNEFVSKMALIQSQVIKSIPPNTAAEETERQVRAAVTKAQDEAARAFKNALDENVAFNNGDFYQQVSSQIGLMDAYFKAMTISFQDVNRNICPQIQNKPACT